MNDWIDAEKRAERAQQLSESRRWAEALAEIDAALEVNPHNSSWLAHRGFLLDQLERFEDGIDAYTEALQSEPDNRELLLSLGVDLVQVGRYGAGLKAFSRLNKLYPDFEPAYCYQIMAYAELGQHDKAEEAFYLAQQIDADCPHCYFHMGLSLAERGANERALFCWNKVVELEPAYDGVKGQMARAFRSMGEMDRAVEFYRTAVREDPGDIELLFEMGDLYAENRDLELAATKFRQVIELAPEHTDAYFALAQIQLSGEKAQDALKTLDELRVLDDEFPGLELLVGSALLRSGRYDDACVHLERATRFDKSNKDALMLHANCLLWLKKADKAADGFRRLIALDATLPSAHHNLGVACFLLGDFEAGIRHCRRAIDLKPNYMLAIIKTARANQKLGQFDQSRAMIRYGLGVDPDNAFLQQLWERLWRARISYGIGRLRSFCGKFIPRWTRS
jgi:tetratricopeptide (TPR) repeat protein